MSKPDSSDHPKSGLILGSDPLEDVRHRHAAKLGDTDKTDSDKDATDKGDDDDTGDDDSSDSDTDGTDTKGDGRDTGKK